MIELSMIGGISPIQLAMKQDLKRGDEEMDVKYSSLRIRQLVLVVQRTYSLYGRRQLNRFTVTQCI